MLRQTKPIKYSKSKTIPGQALIPAELLKRHLAGTLPDIQKNPQFTHDEEGKPTGEVDLSRMELHELHELAQQVKSEFIEREKELAKQEADDYKKKVIEEYQASLAQPEPTLTPGPDSLNPQGPTQK